MSHSTICYNVSPLSEPLSEPSSRRTSGYIGIGMRERLKIQAALKRAAGWHGSALLTRVKRVNLSSTDNEHRPARRAASRPRPSACCCSPSVCFYFRVAFSNDFWMKVSENGDGFEYRNAPFSETINPLSSFTIRHLLRLR